MLSLFKTCALLPLITTGADAFRGNNRSQFFNKKDGLNKNTPTKPNTSLDLNPSDLPLWTAPIELLPPLLLMAYGGFKSFPAGPSALNIPINLWISSYNIYYRLLTSLITQQNLFNKAIPDKDDEEACMKYEDEMDEIDYKMYRMFGKSDSWKIAPGILGFATTYEHFRLPIRLALEQINHGLHP